MIPRQGRRYSANRDAKFQFHPMTEPQAKDDVQVPTVIVEGIRVSTYVDTAGVIRVSIATDEGDIGPTVRLDSSGDPHIRISVNDTNVFEA